jgi:hypothetical protein
LQQSAFSNRYISSIKIMIKFFVNLVLIIFVLRQASEKNCDACFKTIPSDDLSVSTSEPLLATESVSQILMWTSFKYIFIMVLLSTGYILIVKILVSNDQYSMTDFMIGVDRWVYFTKVRQTSYRYMQFFLNRKSNLVCPGIPMSHKWCQWVHSPLNTTGLKYFGNSLKTLYMN